MSALQQMAAMQKATIAARDRLKDQSIATQVKSGKAQVVRVTYDSKGKSTVSPVSEWMPAADVPAYLGQMQ